MSLLKGLKTDDNIGGAERDSVGGFGVIDSGIYPAKVTLAYVTKSAGGAIGLVTGFKTADGKDLRQTFWMTNKNGQNFYEKDGQKNYLPGFNQATALCLLTVGKEVAELDTETKVVNVYSAEARAEVPTKVDMITDLLGQDVILGVVRQTVDKTKKNETTGAYEPTGETREENEIDKIFRAKDKLTVAEIRAGATEAKFHDTWAEKNTGKSRDRSTKGAGTAGAPKAGAPAAGTQKPKQSLFGN